MLSTTFYVLPCFSLLLYLILFIVQFRVLRSHTTIIHPILRRLAKMHSESDLLKATPHIKFHFQFSSVQSAEVE